MTIDEAIKILQRNVNPNIPSGEIKHLDASRLSIEALKAIRKMRHHPYHAGVPKLPGEDIE